MVSTPWLSCKSLNVIMLVSATRLNSSASPSLMAVEPQQISFSPRIPKSSPSFWKMDAVATGKFLTGRLKAPVHPT